MLKFYYTLVALLFISHSAGAQLLAQAGNVKITKDMFEKSYKEMLEKSTGIPIKPTPEQHLEELVRFYIGLQEANRKDLQKHPTVKKALELELYKGLLEVELGKKVDGITISEKEMQDYYARYPQMRSSNIYIRLPENPSKSQRQETLNRANKIYQDVKKGNKKWASYVRSYSDDELTKTIEGDVGYHNRNSVDLSYYSALNKLKVGQISPLVEGPNGFYIIKKTGQFSFERADKSLIKIAIFSKKRADLLDQYFDLLKKRYKVSYNKDLL